MSDRDLKHMFRSAEDYRDHLPCEECEPIAEDLGTVYRVGPPAGPGYHLSDIPKGEIGELSKIREELAEAQDAEDQGVSLMTLLELSDLIGAVEAYLETHHPWFTLDDLRRMSDVTRRAFRSGRRG